MRRSEHVFQFTAAAIAKAAAAEAEYHEQRAAYWREEMDTSYAIVERTAGVKIGKQFITGGWRPEVVVNYGDPAAYTRMQEAAGKIQHHQRAAEQYRSDERLYSTQGDRAYDLGTDDVSYFRLGGQPRED